MNALPWHPVHGRRELLACACVASSGIHATLLAEHLEDGLVAAGGFAAAVVVTGATGIAILTRPHSAWPPRVALAVLAGLLASYALAIAVALPGVPGTPETIDAIGVACKGVEAIGVLLAWTLVTAPHEGNVARVVRA